jgi:hypothetical protein
MRPTQLPIQWLPGGGGSLLGGACYGDSFTFTFFFLNWEGESVWNSWTQKRGWNVSGSDPNVRARTRLSGTIRYNALVFRRHYNDLSPRTNLISDEYFYPPKKIPRNWNEFLFSMAYNLEWMEGNITHWLAAKFCIPLNSISRVIRTPPHIGIMLKLGDRIFLIICPIISWQIVGSWRAVSYRYLNCCLRCVWSIYHGTQQQQ